ncbi:MAG: MDR family MFS transporter [Streptosporangiales bacterium]
MSAGTVPGPPVQARHANEAAPSQRQIMVVFGALMLAVLLFALDQTIVNTALPTIVGDLNGLSHISWVLTAYLLASTVVLLIYGKLGDLFGRKGLFMFAITVFLIGSALCGIAQSMDQLIAFRALQGVGGGGLMIGAQAIIGDVVPPRERGKYMGFIGAVFGLSTIGGPLLGGVFTDYASWRWCFYVNLPLGAAALAVTAFVLHLPKRRQKHRLDVPGVVFMAAASMCIVLLTTWGGTEYDWTSPVIIALGLGFLAAAALFVLAEHYASEPIIPLRLFKDRIFNIAGLIGAVVGICMFGAIGYLPTFLQTVDGASATESGLLLLPFVAGMLVSSIGSGRAISATGRYKIFPIFGTAIAALGMFLLSLMDVDSSRIENGIYMAVLGLGIGLIMQVLVLVVQNSAPRSDMGAATAATTYFRQIGASVGAAVVGSLFSDRLTDKLTETLPASARGHVPSANALTPDMLRQMPHDIRQVFIHAFADALTPVFLYLVPLVAIGFVLAWFLKEIPLRTGSDGTGAFPSATLPPDRRDALVAGLVLSLASQRVTRTGAGDGAVTRLLARLADGDGDGSERVRALRAVDQVVRPTAVALLAHASGGKTPPEQEGTEGR